MIAYVIGVPSRFRGVELVKQLQDAKFEVQLVDDGINGDDWSHRELEEIYDDVAYQFFRYGRAMGAREVACTLAHREVWRRIAASNSEWSIVFEDDAQIIGDLAGVTSQLEGRPRWKPAVVILFDKDNNFNRHLFASWSKRQRSFNRLVMPPGGAIAYLMNKAAAQIGYASTSVDRIDFRTDWPHRWPWSIRFYCLSCPVIAERANVSTLDPERSQRRRLETLSSRPRRYRDLLTGRRWRGYANLGIPFSVFIYQELYLRLVFALVVRPRVTRATRRGNLALFE